MSDYCRSAKKRAKQLGREAAQQFDAAPIHNLVSETVDGSQDRDNDLLRTLDVAERAYELSDDTDDLLIGQASFDAAERINDEIDGLVDNLTAKACKGMVLDGDEWRDTWADEKIDAAQAEAREWLQSNPKAASGAGVSTEALSA